MTRPAPRVTVFDTPYELIGRLAEGEFCDVYWARRRNPSQLVVLKVARDPNDGSLEALRGEARTLNRLMGSRVEGGDYFRSLLPQLEAAAAPDNLRFEETGARAPALVYRWRAGFVHTYEDIAAAYPEGIDARTAVWLWKRSLDGIGWLHRNGLVYTNATPQHFLVHARDHGVALAGWSRCVPAGAPLAARSEGYRVYYPERVWAGGPFTPADDITMTARCLFCVLGGDVSTGRLPDTVPGPLAELIRAHALEGASNRVEEAWDLVLKIDAVARAVFGPPKFHPFNMPPAHSGPTP